LSEYSIYVSWIRSIDVAGNKQDGSRVSHTFQLDRMIDGAGGAADFQTFSFPETFTNLVSVEISPSFFTIDNFVVSGPPSAAPLTDYMVLPDQYSSLPVEDSELLQDSDCDGLNNQGEYIAGSNPTNAHSLFNVTCPKAGSGDGFVVSWDALPGRIYSVWRQSGLGKEFQPLETDIEYPQNSYTDTVHSAESCGFYKVTVDLAPTEADQ
jgi:hypothetical protein